MKLPESHDHPLHPSRRLLSSLSESIPAVRCFRGRWSIVSATLDRLRAALDDLSDLPNLASHPLSSDLLRCLPQTLALTLTLSLHCADPDPLAGKLRTQSDLAAAAASIDQLAADADLLIRSGALLDPPPPPHAAEAPGASSRRESVRAEARALVTRLQIGSPAARTAALDALDALLREDDKNVLIAAAQGVVPALVRLLDSPCRESKEKAVAAVARVSAVESCRHVLLAEGTALLSHLSRVVESDDGSAATESACVALQTLTLGRDNAMAVGSRGCISSLIGICQAGTPPSQAAAAGVLKNLAGVQALRQNFLEDNAIPVLIRVLASSTVLAQENAVVCLRNLAADEGQTLKHSVINEGGLDWLKNYWVAGGDRRLEPAVGLLRNLASSKYIAGIIVSAGFLPLIILALDDTASSARTEAARLISQLPLVGKARKEIGEGQCVPRLVGMLEAKGAEEKEAAVKALASLMSSTGNRRQFRKEERGIVNVVQLLDPLAEGVNKKCPISVLQLVSQSKRCRKQMVVAGACGYLERLVEVEVEGAKRLLESLGRGKLFWGIR